MKQSIREIINTYGKEKKIFYTLSFLLSACAGVLAIAPFWALYLIVKAFVTAGFAMSREVLMPYLKLLAFTQLGYIITLFGSLTCSHFLAFRVEMNMRILGMKKLIRLPLGYFEHHDSGVLRRRVDEGASLTHTYLAHNLPDLWRNMFIVLSFVGLTLLVDLRLGLVNLAGMLFAFLVMGRLMTLETQKLMKEFIKEFIKGGETISATGAEYIRGIPLVKVFQQSVESFLEFSKAIEDYSAVSTKVVFAFRKPMIAISGIFLVPTLVLMPFTLLLMQRSAMPMVVLAKGILMLMFSFLSMMQFITIAKIQETKEQFLQSLAPFLTLEQEMEQEVMEKPSIQEEGIVMKHVTFRYPGREKPVLQDFSFHFKPNTSYALVGPSGSGKSTVLKLIARLYDVDEGSIFYDGKDVRSFTEDERFSHLAMVFQEQSLLHTSLRENITMGLNVDDDEVYEALKKASCEDLLKRMSLDDIIGTGGTYVSGGEAQRLSIARALLRDRKIMLFDEASAYADAENERKLEQTINALKAHTLTISIAHRMSSIQDADEILVLEDGKLVDHGNHEALMARSALYKNLVKEYEKSVQWSIEEARK